MRCHRKTGDGFYKWNPPSTKFFFASEWINQSRGNWKSPVKYRQKWWPVFCSSFFCFHQIALWEHGTLFNKDLSMTLLLFHHLLLLMFLMLEHPDSSAMFSPAVGLMNLHLHKTWPNTMFKAELGSGSNFGSHIGSHFNGFGSAHFGAPFPPPFPHHPSPFGTQMGPSTFGFPPPPAVIKQQPDEDDGASFSTWYLA